MPQLDPAVFLPQIFWLFVIFGLIYLFIAHSAAPRITQVLEKRQARISSDLEEASNLQAEAEAARVSHEKALEEARLKATSTITAKREAIKSDVEAEYAQLTEKLGAEFASAEVKIIAAKDKALDEIRVMSVDICKEIIQSVSGLDLDKKIVAERVSAKFEAVKDNANG
ncbi:hypothetical protein MNBD_ALPHA03-1928 [hydrothermal vent metagenome]|uniref:ATP synthase F0 sector subunit b n=1 Tax=hydrothermal vent metagenome TaxID=652676 RepID=A0A3B1B713_9ZZZZ